MALSQQDLFAIMQGLGGLAGALGGGGGGMLGGADVAAAQNAVPTVAATPTPVAVNTDPVALMAGGAGASAGALAAQQPVDLGPGATAQNTSSFAAKDQMSAPVTTQPTAASALGGATVPGQVQQADLGTTVPGTTTAPGEASQEMGAWDRFMQNISGGPQDPEGQKEWKRYQTLGAIGNALASAIAGDSPVGRGAGALRDVFAGNIAAKNAELRQQGQNTQMDALTQALGGMKPSAVAPLQTSTVPGQASGATASTASTPSALSTTSFGSMTSDAYYDELQKRLQNLGG